MCARGGSDGGTSVVESTRVEENLRLAEGVGLVTLHAPRIAHSVRAGQFVHLRIEEDADFILRRPFSVHGASDARIEILYQVLGKGTRALSLKEPGSVMDAIGPLGVAFPVPDDAAHALVVAGGLGVAPMGLLVEELAARGVATTVAVGAPTGSRLVALERLDAAARRVLVATDDGSAGTLGLVTHVAEPLVSDADVVYACGPEAMSRAVCDRAQREGVRCYASLERLMACGVGACLSCVVSTTDGLRRACVDGPVFDGARIVWDPTETPARH